MSLGIQGNEYSITEKFFFMMATGNVLLSSSVRKNCLHTLHIVITNETNLFVELLKKKLFYKNKFLFLI
jgi:hypothetical protein